MNRLHSVGWTWGTTYFPQNEINLRRGIINNQWNRISLSTDIPRLVGCYPSYLVRTIWQITDLLTEFPLCTSFGGHLQFNCSSNNNFNFGLWLSFTCNCNLISRHNSWFKWIKLRGFWWRPINDYYFGCRCRDISSRICNPQADISSFFRHKLDTSSCIGRSIKINTISTINIPSKSGDSTTIISRRASIQLNFCPLSYCYFSRLNCSLR